MPGNNGLTVNYGDSFVDTMCLAKELDKKSLAFVTKGAIAQQVRVRWYCHDSRE